LYRSIFGTWNEIALSPLLVRVVAVPVAVPCGTIHFHQIQGKKKRLHSVSCNNLANCDHAHLLGSSTEYPTSCGNLANCDHAHQCRVTRRYPATCGNLANIIDSHKKSTYGKFVDDLGVDQATITRVVENMQNSTNGIFHNSFKPLLYNIWNTPKQDNDHKKKHLPN
jgi:hypothetical protein